MTMATYEVNVKSYKRCRGIEVGRLISSMTNEQKQHALDLIRTSKARARLLGEEFDESFCARVTKMLL